MGTLIALIPITYFSRQIFGIGYYRDENNFDYTFSEGTGRLRTALYIDFSQQYNRYLGNLIFETISTGSVGNIGITHYNYSVLLNGVEQSSYVHTYDPPATLRDSNFYPLANKDDNYTYRGIIRTTFLNSGIEMNQTAHFQLTVFILHGGEELTIYRADFTIMWLLVVLVISTIVVAGIAIGLGGHMKNLSRYKEEEKEKDDRFFEYLRTRNKNNNGD